MKGLRSLKPYLSTQLSLHTKLCTGLLKCFEDTEFYSKTFEKSCTKFCTKALIRNIRLERSMRSEKSKSLLFLALIFRFARFERSVSSARFLVKNNMKGA